MITIGRQTDYAARIVLHLASAEGEGMVTASEIAARRLIPPAFIRRIVTRLSQAGILRTVRGSGGGIALARAASEITLKQVVEAMEGPIALNACLVTGSECPLAEACPVQEAWAEGTRNLSNYLDDIRFDGLASRLGGDRKRGRGKPPAAKGQAKGRRARRTRTD